MLPLKPRQCVVLVPDSFLVINGGSFWVNNLYLKLQRTAVSRRFAFLSAGIANGASDLPELTPVDLFVTDTTFQGEHRGWAYGVDLKNKYSRVFLKGADAVRLGW